MQLIFDVLKFAETKNGVVLALTGACIVGILRFFGSTTAQSSLGREWLAGLAVGMVFLCIACIIIIISFLPQIHNVKVGLKKKIKENETDNLFFFGDLYKYESQSLIGAVLKSYKIEDKENYMNAINLSISTQIIEYSKITLNKFTLFKIAAWVLLIGIISIFIVAGITYFLI